MASAAYNSWLSAVRNNNGLVVQPATSGVNPNTGKSYPPKVLSAAYDAAIWVPKVNTGTWPLPDEYSVNGKTAYYHAPAQLQAEAKTFSSATQYETQAGAKNLMNQWGVPTMFQGLSNYFKGIGLIALVVVGAYVVINRK